MRSTICSLCNLRPVGSQPKFGDSALAKSMGYCTPCLTLAEMENTHDDYDHATIAATPEGKMPKGWKVPRAERADRLAHVAAERKTIEACWICHPELDATQAEYVSRAGTTRAGVTHAVPLRASGKGKAEIVQAKLGESFSIKISIPRKSDRVTLRADGAGERIELIWDLAGRFVTGSVTALGIAGAPEHTAKVRNVSEAYRVLGIAK